MTFFLLSHNSPADSAAESDLFHVPPGGKTVRAAENTYARFNRDQGNCNQVSFFRVSVRVYAAQVDSDHCKTAKELEGSCGILLFKYPAAPVESFLVGKISVGKRSRCGGIDPSVSHRCLPTGRPGARPRPPFRVVLVDRTTELPGQLVQNCSDKSRKLYFRLHSLLS